MTLLCSTKNSKFTIVIEWNVQYVDVANVCWPCISMCFSVATITITLGPEDKKPRNAIMQGLPFVLSSCYAASPYDRLMFSREIHIIKSMNSSVIILFVIIARNRYSAAKATGDGGRRSADDTTDRLFGVDRQKR